MEQYFPEIRIFAKVYEKITLHFSSKSVKL